MELQTIIDRLSEDAVLNTMEVSDLKLIVTALEKHLDIEISQRILLDEIAGRVKSYRQAQELPSWDVKGITNVAEDVNDLLDTMAERLENATEDAAGMREMVKVARDLARQGEDKPDEAETFLSRIDYHASEALKEYRTGEARRKEWQQLEAALARIAENVQRDGGWRWSDRESVAEQVAHFNNYYVNMASRSVTKSTTFKNGVIAWLRGIAINAQAVSWASTHHEKDARLRGLIEVIETAISKLDELRMEDHYQGWSDEVDTWLKSDFPTREMKLTILRQEQEIKQLKAQLNGQQCE